MDWKIFTPHKNNMHYLSLRNHKFNEIIIIQASLFEASEREGADSVIKAQSPSQQGDAWRCAC